MAENTKIEWADHTFNPWVGCQVASPDGCANCYAADWAKRYGRDFAQRTRTSEANWKQPLKWNAQAAREGRRFRVFCASLADVFDNQVPVQWRRDLFDLIEVTPHLDWLLLTKRIGTARSLYASAYLNSARRWPANAWLGATVVNQAEADRDIPKLLDTRVRGLFLSVEPMLSPIDLRFGSMRGIDAPGADERGFVHRRAGALIKWVICGGESGPRARPMHPDWARSLRDQCAAADVPFLFKQWGEWIPADQAHAASATYGRSPIREFAMLEGHRVHRVGKNAAGRLLDGVEHNGFPECS